MCRTYHSSSVFPLPTSYQCISLCSYILWCPCIKFGNDWIRYENSIAVASSTKLLGQ